MLVSWCFLFDYGCLHIYSLHFLLCLFFLFRWVLSLELRITAIKVRSILLMAIIMIEDCNFDIFLEMQFLYLYLLVTLLLHWVIIISQA